MFDFLSGGWGSLPAIPEAKSVPPPPAAPLVPGARVIQLTDSESAIFYPTTLGLGDVAPDANSAVYACLQSIAAAIAEPELKVYDLASGERIELDDTELGRLLAHPNAYLSLDALLAYVSNCLHVDGNAYWRKLRSGHPTRGNVVELWPIAPGVIEPQTTSGSGDYISAYRYTGVHGRVETLAVENVVHFRYGLDDDDHRLGYAPLKRLFSEISSDQRATRYADRLLANLAINGLSLEFDKDAPPIDQATADELKARIIAAYGGDNVGSAAVLAPGATLSALGFSPEQLDMKTLHRVPEERISAVLGVPAIVAGLGAGLDRATYSNVREAREMFTEAKLIPLWRYLASEITLQLVPDFYAPERIVVDFDTSNVRALASDKNAEAERLKILVETGILTLDEARAELGYGPAGPSAQTGAQPPLAASSAPGARLVRFATSGRRGSPTTRLATKAAGEDLPARYHELQADELPTWERELIAFFEQQRSRVGRRFHAGADTSTELIPAGEAVLLTETLTPLQLRQLGQVERLVESSLGIAFDLDDPATREYLHLAGEQIGGITDTTRDAVRVALAEGQAAGEGIETLARRLRELPAFGSTRAKLVARTELAHATSSASLASYRGSGIVVGVRVHDGDYDAACAAMDGRVFTLDDAPPTLQHPNCTRAFAPLTDASHLAASA